MEYADHVEALKLQDENLAQEVSHFNTLENVLAWMRQRGLPLEQMDVVTQDEYCHDILIPLEDRWLVFAAT
jgi:hypothetical protein